MSQKRTIRWENYGLDMHGIEKSPDFDDEDSEGFDGFDDDDEEFFEQFVRKMPEVIRTPFGVFRVDDKFNPLRAFEFWLGHTNFDITPEVKEILDETPGVEVLIVTTRYRFIVGVGKMFSFSNVRVDIERQLCGLHKVQALIDQIHNDEVKKSVKDLTDSLRDNQYWAVYLFPNGKYETFTANDIKDYEARTQVLKAAQLLSHGILITSEDADDDRRATKRHR